MISKEPDTWFLVGGGLSNGLLALRLHGAGKRVRLFESQSTVGGHHTWSMHQSDVDDEDLRFLDGLKPKFWAQHRVEFPRFTRMLNSGYLTIRSENLHKAVQEALGEKGLSLNTRVTAIYENRVTTDKGEFEGQGVIAARGFGDSSLLGGGFQKFVGWDVRFDQPHNLASPVLMDARVEQRDGFRFLYLLPFDEHTLLVEDTRYSNESGIGAEFQEDLKVYLSQRWPKLSYQILRKEQAALPIPTFATPTKGNEFGVAGGYFHPTTGYSLPYALKISKILAEKCRIGLKPEIEPELRRQLIGPHGYYRFLNRLLFWAAPPKDRRRIFERFYQLDEGLIQRFYAGQSSLKDQARILLGRPPVKLTSTALALWKGGPAWT
ncbi:MAG: lycopene beta-cyclase CrtY [Bdellovibrionales bacterium]